jgi:hypothetical protein
VCMPSGGNVCTVPCCPNAVHVSDAKRPRRWLAGERHLATNVAVVVCSTHPEPAGRHGTVCERIACMSDGRQSGYEAGEDQRAHHR